MYSQTTFGHKSMKALNAITSVLNNMENKKASRYWASMLSDINEVFSDLSDQSFKSRQTITVATDQIEKYFQDKIDVQVFRKLEYQERTHTGNSIVLQTHTKNILRAIKNNAQNHLLKKLANNL